MQPHRISPLVFAALVAAAVPVACRRNDGPPATANAPAAQAAPPAGQPEEPRCVMSCSQDTPGVVIAEISWPLAERAASRQAAGDAASQQSLEVTTFKDGFASGRYAQLGSVRENQGFASRAAAPDATLMAGLEGLRVTRVEPLAQRIESGASRSADALMPAAAGGDTARVVVVEIQGLKPGLNYFWRRSASGPVVRCQAPVCPRDGRGR